MEVIKTQFPELTSLQLSQLEKLEPLYKEWNSMINVISRKDTDNFYERHVLHSLGIAKVMSFKSGTKVLDVGTGGGFPGIPLAILFPEVHFTLVDSIGKKIKVVTAVVEELGLKNVVAIHGRAEKTPRGFDFVISRAVTRMPAFYSWIRGHFNAKSFNDLKNGILYLKGGDLSEELADFPKAVEYDLSQWFDGEFFETKKVVYVPASR
ncbi:MAG: 16S rRNA (guanine(527)-N(7))-methyltransferase RsmG [Flavobacteriia bacterium]|nr:16S rRNA (guanine(527)-N(7))-methyltransferase RsmG [Flavobacteriia bacterium]